MEEHTSVEVQVDSAVLFKSDASTHSASEYLHRALFPANHPAGARDLPEDHWAITYNAGWRNYYHWTLQCVFSAFLLSREEGRPYRFLFPAVSETARELLHLAGVPEENCRFEHKAASVAFRRVTTISTTYGDFVYRPSPLLPQFASAVARSISYSAAPGQRIFVSRRDTQKRVMENEEALERLLHDFGFKTVTLTGTSIAEQVALFSGATTVVAPHGAGLTNLLYCRPGTSVLELTPGAYVNGCFLALAPVLGLQYILSVHGGASGGHGPNWTVDLPAVEEALVSMVS